MRDVDLQKLLFAAVAQHVEQGAVGIQELPLLAADEDAAGHVFEKAPVIRLESPQPGFALFPLADVAVDAELRYRPVRVSQRHLDQVVHPVQHRQLQFAPHRFPGEDLLRGAPWADILPPVKRLEAAAAGVFPERLLHGVVHELDAKILVDDGDAVFERLEDRRQLARFSGMSLCPFHAAALAIRPFCQPGYHSREGNESGAPFCLETFWAPPALYS